MSWTDKFFTVEEDNKSKHQEVSKTVNTANNTSNTPIITDTVIEPSSIITPSVASNADVDENIVRTIWNTLISKNLPGPDFLEVKNSANALEGMGLSEDKRYEAAFKMLKTTYPSFSKDILLSSIDTYINYVREEENLGKAQCDKKRKENIGDRQARVIQLKEHAEQIMSQIAQLQNDYDAAIKSISSIETEIAESTKKIDMEEAVFKNSIKSVINTLESDKNTMSMLNI